jgi:hypothetical protein
MQDKKLYSELTFIFYIVWLMKKLQMVFLVILIFVLFVFGIESFGEFMANHTYYNDMFASWTNWKLILAALVSAMIPGLYLLFHKQFSLKRFLLMTGAGLLLFSIIHTSVKDSILGGGFITFIFNNIVLFVLGIYFIL